LIGGIVKQKAFNDLKSYLQQLTTLSSLEQGQPLILYVSATHVVVSGALVQEKEVMKNGKTTKQQFLVYFVLEVLMGSKRYYSKMEKIWYAVVMSARKLYHYFEVHTIRVLTSQPLKDIFSNRYSSGWISKWAMELSEHIVNFEKRSAIKLQIIADFTSEWTEPSSYTEGQVPESPWLIYYDGAWGNARAGAAAILISPFGIKLRYTVRLQFTK
jgi:hypothetical protein